MAFFFFDFMNQFEMPVFTLANPNGSELYNLGQIYDRILELRYNALSKFSFTAPKIVNGIETDYYNFLDYRRIVMIENIGNFMIVDLEMDNDGRVESKKITCQSLECELNFKKLSLFKGTYKFYDLIDPSSSLLGYLLNYLPGWSIGSVSGELNSLYRTFDVTDKTIYAFLMNEVSQAYQCIFEYDTINKKISAYTVADATTNTDIYLSYDNLVEKTNIKEITSELVTALNVYGGGDLRINIVNPLGNDTIYNFDYYKNSNWMSGSLIAAIDDWEAKIAINQQTYADTLTLITENNTILLAKQFELANLQNDLLALQEVQKVRIQQGLPIAAINAQINAKQGEINAKNSEISGINSTISGLNDILVAINADLAISANFTPDGVLELGNFIIGSTYTNSNFIKTDIMSASAIQATAQELYDQAQDVLVKVSEPRYTFSLDAVNFGFLKEFQIFIDQLVMGAIVTIDLDNGNYVHPALLGININYDEPTQFSLVFSNRLRLDDSAFQFSDLFNQSIDTGITATFNSEMWSNWDINYKDDVTTFISSQLDAAKNAVTSGSGQEIIINATGLRGRQLASSGSNAYNPKQFWMINNMLAFTDDGWDSAKLALGEILVGPGAGSYGLVADAVFGRLLAGNQLFITNETSTFSVSGSNASLINAELSLTRTDNNTRINLDPNYGIRIQKRDALTGNYINNFWVDADGNIIFTGNLQGASGDFTGAIHASSGTIGAWTIDQWGLKDTYGNYIYGTGKVRLGMLTIEGSEAWFNGNIYAQNINGLIEAPQIGSLNADVINAGTIRGINIYGSTIAWPGVVMEANVVGKSQLTAFTDISLNAANSALILAPNLASLESAGGQVRLGSIAGGATTTIIGNLQTIDSNYNQGWGTTTDIIVNSNSGSQILSFVNGILVDPYHYQASGSSGGGSTPTTLTFSVIVTGADTLDMTVSVVPSTSCVIDWGDSSFDTCTTSTVYSHNYSGAGTYTLNFESPENITFIQLLYQDIVHGSISGTNQWPSGMKHIDLYQTNISWEINSSNPIPSGVDFLSLATVGGGLITWIPVYPLPTGLEYLYLNCDHATDFQGTGNFLPSSLKYLNILYCDYLIPTFANFGDIKNIQEIYLYGTNYITSWIDQILQSIWENKSSYTYGGTIYLNLQGNSSPSGTYASSCPPTTGNEYRYDLTYGICTPDGPEWNVQL